ncbi:tRNA lysidine(34) synthetase TilS [Lentibacter sp. XHP0401]|uniref:tRNA lysidine(34) synthetase TilS n=1 Tax=Lentibacter sp. XHP0401 TaxID=2984334 RepID=UPI0021E75E94|nr:tRNA lysidine(34) synthetase TilS [Lentibacter sp. XHP0401]MCV2894139.1 tRNA lysidine(34) synthetase TilS [Lentibacter sp. XHP0401]
MTLADRLSAALEGAVGPLGLAVSGGSDSLALLRLVAEAARGPLFCATVNHGLREEAAGECAMVAQVCAELGVTHDILDWRWNGDGNLQAEARAGRYAALKAWARERGVGTVLLGHTQDDVAETFLMRMARGSGVKGLAKMSAAWEADGLQWRRPLLQMSRGELRDFLNEQGQVWAEDASNADTRYKRVSIRAALAKTGLDAARIAETAERLAQADAALETMAHAAAGQLAQLQGRNIVIEAAGLAALPDEIRHRLMSAWCAWQGRTQYPPRHSALAEATDRALNGQGSTLNGCVTIGHKGRVIIAREAKAAPDTVEGLQAWDALTLEGDWPEGATLGALGEAGLREVTDWRTAGLPRAAQLAAPAIWLGARLFAAPSVGFGAEFTLKFEVEPPYMPG